MAIVAVGWALRLALDKNMRIRVWDLGNWEKLRRTSGLRRLGCMLLGFVCRFKNEGLQFRVEGSWFRVQGHGSGFNVPLVLQ